MQGRVLEGVLFFQGVVLSIGRMAVTRLVVRALNLAQAELQRGAPATVALVATVDGHDAEDDGSFAEVGSEPAPKGVPLARFVRDPRDLQ